MARERKPDRAGPPDGQADDPFGRTDDADLPFGDEGSVAVSAPEPSLSGRAVAQRRSGNRVVAFLRASWAELQRVQWPDRRQVAQASGVVLGFVVVAAVFLGVADYVSQKIVNAIL